MNVQTLTIEGMTCNGCAARVAKTLKEIPGVSDAKVSLADKTAEVTSHCAIDASLLTSAVESKGYHVILAEQRNSG